MTGEGIAAIITAAGALIGSVGTLIVQLRSNRESRDSRQELHAKMDVIQEQLIPGDKP